MSISSRSPTLLAPVPDFQAFRRTCCCCIPVRAGVIFFSFFGLFGGIAVAAVAIYSIVHQTYTGSKLALIIQVISYILLALVSLVGLIGAIGRKLVCIRASFIILVIHLLASFGTGVYAIHLVFLQGPDYTTQCQSSSEDPTTVQSCVKSFTLLKAFVIAVYTFAWLIEIWASVIVYKYMKQLGDEERAKKALKASETW